MLSLKSISTVKSAIQTCLIPELKEEILCAPGSEYDITKVNNKYDRKQQWNEIVERKARTILTNKGLPKKLQDSLIAIIPAIGLRMLIWAEYHEGTLGFTREYSISFLKYSHFTLKGVIDNTSAAKQLIKDNRFSIEQKYKIACIYCLTDKIDYLYRQMVGNGMQTVWVVSQSKWIQVPEVVKLWTHEQMGVIDTHHRSTPLYQYKIKQAIKSGSKAAVEYFWAMMSSKRQTCIIRYAVHEVLRTKESMRDDWIVFRDRRYNGSEESWVPNDYYVDIMCFLLSTVTPEDQKDILQQVTKYYDSADFVAKRYRVLEMFLRFPYQDHFMKLTAVIRDVVPETTYAVLLLEICEKIEPQKERNLYYGEEKSYRYRSLLKEFWCQSPDHYKRYVFEIHEVKCMTNEIVKTGFCLLMKLLSLKKFTNEDEEIFRLIIASASDEERENIVSSKEWKNNCIKLMKDDRWEILDRFLTYFLSSEKADKFKRELSFTEEAKCTCLDFLKYNRWNAAESFVKWISLPEQLVNELKKEIIYSKNGQDECLKLLTSNRMKTVNKFIRWCLPSNGEAIALKAKLVSELSAKCHRVHVTEEHILELVDHFSRKNRPTKKQVNQLKKSVANAFGCTVCEELISDYSLDFTFDGKCYDEIQTRIVFSGGKWEKVDKFLAWCFSNKEEIDDFKKNKIFKTAGVKILFSLIKSKQLAEAEKFLAWLGLSEEEKGELKKKTLFHDREAWMMFSELVFSKEKKELCSYFCKQDETEEILLWLLRDKETVLEFRDAFMREYETSDDADLKQFNKKIDRYLIKLYYEHQVVRHVRVSVERILESSDQNQSGAKRKSGTFPSNNKQCRSKLEGKEEQNLDTRILRKSKRHQKSSKTKKN